MSERGQALVKFARARVRQELGGAIAVPPEAPWGRELCATFVTLRWQNGDLQGCIGNLDADRAIVQDVAFNAVAAATRDPRGQKLELADLDKLDVELSILSPLERIASTSDIRVAQDGVVLVWRGRRATFLPVMWGVLRDLQTFMGELEKKAGLPPGYDAAELELFRYTAEHHKDPAP